MHRLCIQYFLYISPHFIKRKTLNTIQRWFCITLFNFLEIIRACSVQQHTINKLINISASIHFSAAFILCGTTENFKEILAVVVLTNNNNSTLVCKDILSWPSFYVIETCFYRYKSVSLINKSCLGGVFATHNCTYSAAHVTRFFPFLHTLVMLLLLNWKSSILCYKNNHADQHALLAREPQLHVAYNCLGQLILIDVTVLNVGGCSLE